MPIRGEILPQISRLSSQCLIHKCHSAFFLWVPWTLSWFLYHICTLAHIQLINQHGYFSSRHVRPLFRISHWRAASVTQNKLVIVIAVIRNFRSAYTLVVQHMNRFPAWISNDIVHLHAYGCELVVVCYLIQWQCRNWIYMEAIVQHT